MLQSLWEALESQWCKNWANLYFSSSFYAVEFTSVICHWCSLWSFCCCSSLPWLFMYSHIREGRCSLLTSGFGVPRRHQQIKVAQHVYEWKCNSRGNLGHDLRGGVFQRVFQVVFKVAEELPSSSFHHIQQSPAIVGVHICGQKAFKNSEQSTQGMTGEVHFYVSFSHFKKKNQALCRGFAFFPICVNMCSFKSKLGDVAFTKSTGWFLSQFVITVFGSVHCCYFNTPENSISQKNPPLKVFFFKSIMSHEVI